MKKISSFIIISTFLFAGNADAQLYISAGSTFFIQPAGVVTVQGDVTGLTDIQGGGKVLLKGSTSQNVNMNGFTIPNLEIDNTSNATLTGNTRIGSSLLFTNGKIFAAGFNMNLANVATVSGMGTSKFVETAGVGQVIKELTTDVTASEIPVGAGTTYRPAFITTTGAGVGNIGIQVLGVPDPNRPPSLSDYISAYWPVTKTGVTGTVSLTGQYAVSDISGTESFLTGHFYSSPDWSSAGESHNNVTHQITAPITTPSGDLSAMDKFDLVSAKAYLQGAYTAGGVMAEGLRSGTNVIPSPDPYRVDPVLTANFTHVNNPLNENAPASVFVDHGDNTNIIDWVYLELRNNNASPGNAVLETRSALIQRNGNIVDVDGVSPVTFNRLAGGTYTLAVRHRNHLGISTDPATFTHVFGETKTGITLVDFSTATDAQLFGPATAFTISGDGKNLLWCGNANANGTVRFTGLNNDKDQILNVTLGGSTVAVTPPGYYTSDLNMNKVVRYSGLNNDRDVLLNTALGGSTVTIRTQALPN